MIIIFCDNGYSFREPDDLYSAEYAAARTAGLQTGLIRFETLTKGRDATDAVRRLPFFETEKQGVYRGWMLKPTEYEALYRALLQKNIRLINNPAEYRFCHYLPEGYGAIEGKTPRSVWLDCTDGYDDTALLNLAGQFNGSPIIVKDYVKSQKHYWEEACYIPDSNDQQKVLAVTERFLALQDDDLNVGVVYREFVPFAPLTQHSKSGMPLTREYRAFVKDGRIICLFKYWEEGEYDAELPDPEIFRTEINRVNSNFFTLDIAQKTDGEWLIVELGDGQVAGLPEHADPLLFYQCLWAKERLESA